GITEELVITYERRDRWFQSLCLVDRRVLYARAASLMIRLISRSGKSSPRRHNSATVRFAPKTAAEIINTSSGSRSGKFSVNRTHIRSHMIWVMWRMTPGMPAIAIAARSFSDPSRVIVFAYTWTATRAGPGSTDLMIGSIHVHVERR